MAVRHHFSVAEYQISWINARHSHLRSRFISDRFRFPRAERARAPSAGDGGVECDDEAGADSVAVALAAERRPVDRYAILLSGAAAGAAHAGTHRADAPEDDNEDGDDYDDHDDDNSAASHHARAAQFQQQGSAANSITSNRLVVSGLHDKRTAKSNASLSSYLSALCSQRRMAGTSVRATHFSRA